MLWTYAGITKIVDFGSEEQSGEVCRYIGRIGGQKYYTKSAPNVDEYLQTEVKAMKRCSRDRQRPEFGQNAVSRALNSGSTADRIHWIADASQQWTRIAINRQ